MIKLFTDSSANLPEEFTKKHNITVIPFSVIYEDGTCQDATDNFDGKVFYNLMRNGEKISTSMINAATYENYFSKELKCGNDILYIGMSGGISGALQASITAKENLLGEFCERKIYIVNTLAASLGEGLLVFEAAKMIEENTPDETVYRKTLLASNSMCQYFTVDDLEYLRRGGRIHGATALVGNLLDIKPILTGDAEGHIVSYGKVRGRARALKELVKKYEELVVDKRAAIGISHADSPKDAETLLKMLKDVGFCGECITECFEPVTGAHVGPDTLALFFQGIRK